MSVFKNSVHFFIFISLVFGVLFTLLIPPFQSPDEYNHFYKSWHVSDGNLFSQKLGENRLGGNLPKSLSLLKDQFHYLKGDHEAKTSFNALLKAFQIPLKTHDTAFIDFVNTAVYSPTSYLPQALGITVGKVLSMGPLQILYLARLINLFVWIFFVVLALKRLEFQQWSMAYVACLPSFIVMSASVNADNITNGICLWLIAILCTSKHFPFLLKIILMTIVCINKLIFLPLVLLEWVHKKDRFSFFLLSIIAISATLLWGSFAQKQVITYENYHKEYRDSQTMNEGVNPKLQMKFIIDHPLDFTMTVIVSFTKSLPATTAHLFGKFGWEKNYLPFWAIGLLIIGLLIMILTQSNPLSDKERIFFSISLFSSILLFAIIMYMIWCPVGSDVIDNIGGRYFFVFLAMIPQIVGGSYFKRYTTKLQLMAKVILIIGNIIMLFSIIGRYY